MLVDAATVVVANRADALAVRNERTRGAYKTEQEAWRTWNDMHLSCEAEFSAPRTPLEGT